MSNPTRRRWAVLVAALAATIGAILYPVEEEFTEQPVISSFVAQPVMAVASMQTKAALTHPLWIASDENPFAPRLWEPPPQPVPTEMREVKTVEIEQAPEEQPPPPLPYKFLGQMQNDGERILYLGRGDQVLLAKKGDVVENSYKVVEISDVQVEFESVQLGIRQSLPIPAQ